ncbi:alpha/beta hydrolase [bacterium]|nr:MAG: alpha/beta hydrolase [bacterium]
MGFLGAALIGAAVLSSACVTPRPREAGGRETVFLVHGMGRTRASMLFLAHRLRKAGYRTVNVPYNHAARSLDEVTAGLQGLVARESGGRPYHLVGHSLGNVVIRNGFKAGYPPGLGRVVMLAPPNAPAHLAVELKDSWPYRWVGGDSGQRLADPEFYRGLPAPSVEFGVLAGDKGQALTFSEPNDGIVAVSETRLEGMKDFRVLHRTHTFLMNAPDAFAQCLAFLRNGRFD